ncbi:hypothetical protein [Paenibacillus protaetiae]|uniref:DUF975 family protein n=1 Tax=Paenibacillus protaetiae TaxID=2509456 RepID=A0A4P6EWH1_9BACL|nr:hypothetical protein [Paenibacillus protaetiae]QAY67374.1 hypothetical protein ET464_14210 [Paenibacillus protaetiae]
MKTYLKQGWRLAVKHMYIIVFLFIYQLIWGFFLYRYLDSAISPLLQRWPAESPSHSAVQLFLSEAQFRLLKTDLATPYLWTLGGLLAARMLMTPVLNAGLFHSIHYAKDDNSGTRFFQGIKKSWKKIVLLYVIQAALAIAPAFWLLPRGFKLLWTSSSIQELLSQALPWAAAWLLWGFALHLISLAMQFGAVSGAGPFKALGQALTRLIPYLAVTIAMWGISAVCGLLLTGVSLIWAGLIALILHQSYSFIRTLLKVWTVASQYECLQAKEAS